MPAALRARKPALLVLTGAEPRTIAARQVARTTELKAVADPVDVKLEYTQRTWFFSYVAPVVGYSVALSARDPFALRYYGLQVHLRPNPGNDWIASAASRTSHKKARGSRCINGLAVAVDAVQHIGVAHRTGLHQIHAPAQQRFQISLCAKNRMKPGLDTRCKLHQKVCIAASRVKVTCPCSRTKHLQPLNAVALADGGNAGAVLGDGGVHWAKCTGGVFRAPAT